MTGPNNLVKAALLKVTHFKSPFATTVAALGLSLSSANSICLHEK